jgi:hypothetical protein
MMEIEFAEDFGSLNRHRILVCSPRRNAVTGYALADASDRGAFSCDFGEASGEDGDRWLRFDGRTYSSAGDEDNEDFALLAKYPNPWDDRYKVVIVAGIMTVGTWGAAEYLQTQAEQLDEKTQGHDFAAVLDIQAEQGKSTVSARLTRDLKVFTSWPEPSDSQDAVAQRDPVSDHIVTSGRSGLVLPARPDPSWWGPEPDALFARTIMQHDEALTLEQRTRLVTEGSLTIDEAAQVMGVESSVITEFVTNNAVASLETKDGVVLPDWQFAFGEEPRLLEGVPRLMAEFPGDVLALSQWMHRPTPDLGFRTPHEALLEGDVDEVMRLVAALGAAAW